MLLETVGGILRKTVSNYTEKRCTYGKRNIKDSGLLALAEGLDVSSQNPHRMDDGRTGGASWNEWQKPLLYRQPPANRQSSNPAPVVKPVFG